MPGKKHSALAGFLAGVMFSVMG